MGTVPGMAPSEPPNNGGGRGVRLRGWTERLIPVAECVIGLGAFLYAEFGLQRVGISFLVAGGLLLVLYLSSLVNTPLKNAFREIHAVLASPIRAVVGTFGILSSNLAKLVFSLLLVVALIYLASFLGWIGSVYTSAQERNAVAHLTTANTCLERDDYSCATHEAEEARALLPNDIRVDEVDLRARVLKLAQDDAFFHDASQTEVESARTQCDFLLNRRPNDPDFVAIMGIIDSLRDDPYGASAKFNEAAKSPSAKANVHNYWGFDLMMWQLEDGWPNRARTELETATKLNPKYPVPEINLAMLTLDREKPGDATFKNAEAHLSRAEQASPADYRVNVALGEVYVLWGQWWDQMAMHEEAAKKYKLAEDELEKAYTINPHSPFVLEALGELLVAQKADTRRAIQRFKDALEARPDYVEARDLLGHQYENAGNTKAALTTFAEALEMARRIALRLEERKNRAVREDVSRRLGKWLQEEQDKIGELQKDIERAKLATKQ